MTNTVMHPLIWKKMQSWILRYQLFQNIGINYLFLLHLSFNFIICPIFMCEFIFLLIVFHIPLCNVRQPYKGCPLTCFLAEITRNETVWRMRTNNVKRVYNITTKDPFGPFAPALKRTLLADTAYLILI